MRNKILFIYNGSQQDQEWTIYSEGVINQTITVGQDRKTFTLSISGDTTIQFGVDSTIYLTATYTYATDTWASQTATPNEISFTVAQSAISVTSDFNG